MAANRLCCVLSHLRSPLATGYQRTSAVSLEKNIFSVTSRKCLSSNDRLGDIKTATVLVKGINFHYEETGHGEHTLLLLPGALGSTRTDFLPQLTGLSREKYRIIALDLRGYGKSRPPERDWPLKFYQRDADDVAAFMKALEIPRYSLLGWSDGSIVGLILAAAHPGNVIRLVIWGSNAYVSEVDLQLYKKVADIDKWSPQMRQPFIDIYGEKHLRKLWEEWSRSIQLYVTQMNGDLCIGSLPNIKCPTLIVNGKKDSMVSSEHSPFLQKHIQNSRVVDFPEGKHNLHLRFHKEFNALVEKFLDEELQLKY